jgi:hypothetical protein
MLWPPLLGFGWTVAAPPSAWTCRSSPGWLQSLRPDGLSRRAARIGPLVADPFRQTYIFIKP